MKDISLALMAGQPILLNSWEGCNRQTILDDFGVDVVPAYRRSIPLSGTGPAYRRSIPLSFVEHPVKKGIIRYRALAEHIVFASYYLDSYEGYALVILDIEGQLYLVAGSH